MNDCQCQSCQNACRFKPGWLKQGEEIKIAEFLGLTTQELFDRFLLVDWWQAPDLDHDYFGLSPAVKHVTPGGMFPYNPKGECVFFEEGKCKIHAVKPHECREMHHTKAMTGAHEAAAKSWDDEKGQKTISSLLGYNPIPPEAESAAELFGLF